MVGDIYSKAGADAKFFVFQKEDGTPLTASRVVITVSNDGTTVTDIKVVS